MSAPVSNSVGTTTVDQIYTIVCQALLEDSGLSVQATPAQFIEILQAVYLDFLERAELCQTVYTQMLDAFIDQYTYPDDLVRVESAFVDGVLIEEVSLNQLDHTRPDRFRKLGKPEVWHQDQLPLKTIEVADVPQWQGDQVQPAFGDFFAGTGNLSLVGPVRPAAIALALGANQALSFVPDSFAVYLAYGVLQKLFSLDGDLKSPDRAEYARARFEEGIFLAQAISNRFAAQVEMESQFA